MTYRHHSYTTLAMMYACTGSFAATAIATLSAAFPDVLEIWRYPKVVLRSSNPLFRSNFVLMPDTPGGTSLIPHRTYTHYPWFYVALALPCWTRLQHNPGFWTYLVYFMIMGCLCHLSQDFLSKGGIPFVTPRGQRIGFNLYQVREISELYTAGGISVICAILALSRGLLSTAYLMAEANRFSLLVFAFAHDLFGV